MAGEISAGISLPNELLPLEFVRAVVGSLSAAVQSSWEPRHAIPKDALVLTARASQSLQPAIASLPPPLPTFWAY